MYNLIKKLLNPKKPAPVMIAFDSLPAWIAGREGKAQATLEEAAAVPMQKIRNSAAHLQHIINSISGSEHDPALHPKLRAVAKNSLPLYVRAMNAALEKPLSDDIEEFYHDAVECLKSSLNGNRGQGRYLQAVFPEEMKGVKGSIDEMGRELNLLTAAIATFQKQKALLDAVTALYRSVADMHEDLKRSREKEHRVTARIGEITRRLGEIKDEESRDASDEKNRAVDECRSLLAEKERKRNDVNRNYTARSMTASHLMRKAEKIAAKQHHPADAESLRQAIALLSDHELPDAARMSAALAVACPVVQRMIDAGEIPLKNREERELFSDTRQFCTMMPGLCTELRACDDACRNAETTLVTHPVVVRAGALAREKAQLTGMLKKETDLHSELLQWNERTTGKIPAVTEELRKTIEGIIGENVQLQTDTNAPVRG